MKTFCVLVAALVLLLFPPTAAAEDGSLAVPGFSSAEADIAQKIGVVGPATAEVGDEVTLRLTGTPPVDLSRDALPLIDQLKWLMGESRMFCYVASPGKPLQPLGVRGELVFVAAGVTMEPLVRFLCEVPGEFRLLVDWNHGQNQLVEHRLVVGGVVPPVPPPVPPGPDPPVPPGEKLVLVVWETLDRTHQQAGVVAALRRYLDGRGQTYRVMDPTTKATWLQPYLAELKRRKVSLPALMVSVLSTAGRDVVFLVVESLPGGSREAIARIEEVLDHE